MKAILFNPSAVPTEGDVQRIAASHWWDEDTSRRLDKIASENHSYIATWYERQRYENNCKVAFNTQGKWAYEREIGLL